MDETYHSPQYIHFKKLCEDLDIGAITTVIATNTGLSSGYCDDLKNKGKIPPLNRVGTKKKKLDEDTSGFRSIVEQAGVPARKLEPAIQYGITAYMLQQIDRLEMDDGEFNGFLKKIDISVNQWERWVSGEEEIPPHCLSLVEKSFAVEPGTFSNYKSLKKHKKEIFKKFVEDRETKKLLEKIDLTRNTDEYYIVVNHYGTVSAFSGTEAEMDKVIKKVKTFNIKALAEFRDTKEYTQELERRINLLDSKPC